MTIDEIDHAVDERLSLEVAYFAECEVAAEMIVAVRITTRTAQRTFSRDFNR